MRISVGSNTALLLLFGFLPLLLAAQNGAKMAAPVRIAAVSKQALAPATWVAGTVVSRNDARVAAEISGRLIWVAEVGQQIQEGQPVAKLENTQQRLQLAELKAVLAKEKARLVFLRQEVNRLQRLARENNAAKNRLEQAQADRDVASSELAAAKARLRLAKDNLNRSVLRAPFTGMVTQRLKQKGEWVSDGNAVVRVLDAETLEIQASVPISSRTYLRVGQTLKIRASDLVNSGVIRVLVPVGDEKSRLMDLRVDFTAKGWSVGQSVRVAIPTANPKEVLTLPRDALVLRRSGTSVFKIDATGNAQRVSVATGIAEGQWIEVSGELKAGDQVVIRGGERLRSGQPVKIMQGTAKP